MADNTKIQWADHTFNPWIGCQKVSPGCDNCYAEDWDRRFHGAAHWGPGAPRRRTSNANWHKAITWDRKAAEDRRRYRVFCASMADVFDNQVPATWRDDVWSLIDITPNLDWLLLTKRPENIRSRLPWTATPWPNVWLGVSVEDRRRKHRINTLRDTPATLRFLSIEPLLEDLGEIDLTGIGWVIIGGESGAHARPFDIGWARSTIAQCKAAGVPVFVKQLGARPFSMTKSDPFVWWRPKDGPEAHERGPFFANFGGKADNPAEWPADLRVREFPKAAA